MQTVEGKWSEVDNEEVFDVVAEMILLAEPDVEFSSDIQPQATDDVAAAAQKELKKTSVFTRLFNRLKKHSASVEHLEAADSPQACASAQAPDQSAYQIAMNVIMNKLTQHITNMRGKIRESKVSKLSCKQRLKSKWVYFTDSGGQPQYHELLPLFMRRISSALCVIPVSLISLMRSSWSNILRMVNKLALLSACNSLLWIQ